MIRRIPKITAEAENFRVVPVPGMRADTIRRDPVEPVPVDTYVTMVFLVTGYDQDCDGSLMARLAAVDANGATTGWRQDGIGLAPESAWIVDGPGELDQLAHP